MIRILYVHGYNGKPNGESFQKLADADWKDLSPEFLEKMYKRFFENHIDMNY